jgi:hypothetical protein
LRGRHQREKSSAFSGDAVFSGVHTTLSHHDREASNQTHHPNSPHDHLPPSPNPARPQPPSAQAASILFPAPIYTPNSTSVETSHVTERNLDVERSVVLTYNAVYSTLSPRKAPSETFSVAVLLTIQLAFSLSHTNHLQSNTPGSRGEEEGHKKTESNSQLSNPATFPANTAPMNNGAFSSPFACAASARSNRAYTSAGTAFLHAARKSTLRGDALFQKLLFARFTVAI